MAVRTVEPARSQRLFNQMVKTITASGAHSVAAETISGSTVVTGDNNVVQRGKYNISMGSVQGAVIGDNAQVEQRFSSVDTGGGDYVGRDQTIHGDLVKGDKIGGAKVKTGGITGSNVTFGSGSPITTTQGLTAAEIAALFQPLTQMIQQAPAEKRDEAIRLEQELQAEVAKGEKADDGRMAGLLNGLLKLVPGAVGAAVSIFATPVLSGVAGVWLTLLSRKGFDF